MYSTLQIIKSPPVKGDGCEKNLFSCLCGDKSKHFRTKRSHVSYSKLQEGELHLKI